MLTEAQKAEFRAKGFLLVPGVLTKEQVAELRAASDRLMADPSPYAGDLPPAGNVFGGIRLDVFARYPEFRWVMFHEPIVTALRSLLGENFVCVPETGLHVTHFGGWHKDTYAQERVGLNFGQDPNYLMVEAAIYLQDNDEFGGGLDVVPGSHLRPKPGAMEFSDKAWDKWRRKIRNRVRDRFSYSVPSKPGDLVIFDYRIDHRASPRKVEEEPPAGRHKIALFWACGHDDPTTFKYIDFIKSRKDYIYLQDHSYPTEMIARATSMGMQMPD